LAHAVVGSSIAPALITIPGLAGDLDIVPAAPSAFNDEFDQNTAGVPAGWTSTVAHFGTLPVCNTNDHPSHLHLQCGPGTVVQGIWKPAPPPPFTVITKISDAITYTNQPAAGLWVSAFAPGSGGGGDFMGLEIASFSSDIAQVARQFCNNATGAIGVGAGFLTPCIVPCYLKYVVTATTQTRYWSQGGHIWFQDTTVSGAGISNAYVGLYVTTNGGTVNGEATFDWIRFF
jgi:hypothetical protein